MIWKLPEPRFDVASALDQGNRDYQEDSIVTDFAVGDDCGIVVLADGMGGHAAGDVASKIVVTEVYSELKFNSDMFFGNEAGLPELMSKAVDNANACIRDTMKEGDQRCGMGSTVIASVIAGNRMFWLSVGDSPLYHFRSGTLTQVNEDHSMAPQIDALAAKGEISAQDAKDHPDRNALTSAIAGGRIARIDNRGIAMELKAGDVIVVSSDGLQFLEEPAIARIIARNRRKPSADIANALLQAVKKLEHPEQDNISFAVVKVRHEKPVKRPMRRGNVTTLDFHATRLAEPVEGIGEDAEVIREAVKG